VSAASGNAIVEARDVSYAAGGVSLIAHISLALAAGRSTIVTGPNGAGKSTLLRVMAGELPCTSGSLCYGNADVRQLPPWGLAARRAVMAQATRVAFSFSVYEVVRIGVDGLGRKLLRTARDRLIAEALAQAEISHLAERAYHSLSGGEQQRVQFARVICQLFGGKSSNAPQAAFFDEPTAHLDMTHQLMLMDDVRRLAQTGIAVFVTMHDLNLAAAYADHLVVLKSGQLVAQGRPYDVLTNELLAEVFCIDGGIGEVPPPGTPFFLPHLHAAMHKGTGAP
jgi:iron complex transport system ATP-binding protein